MYIFPKNSKFTIAIVVFSIIYITLAITCAMRYAHKELEKYEVEIRDKSRALYKYDHPRSVSYYDVIRDNEEGIIPHFEKTTIPDFNNGEFKGIRELYYTVRYDTKKPMHSVYLIPWVVECIHISFSMYGQFEKWHIFPYAVGFKKHSNNKYKDACMAVAAALRSYKNTYNHNSHDYYERFSSYHFTESNLQNKYFYTRIHRRNGSTRPITTDSLWVNYRPLYPRYYDYGNCRVYMQIDDHDAIYTILHNRVKFTNQKKKYSAIGVLSWIVIICLILWVKKHHREKRISELQTPLYDRLKTACSPKNFLNPYNWEKVLLANELYGIISKTDKDDEESINSLYLRAHTELGINVLDDKRLNQLEELTNPSLFMTPYNEQKVLLANDLHSKLKDRDSLLYKDYIEIEEKVTNLYKQI